MRPILECRDLTKKYGRKYALSGLNLVLERGQIAGLLGPNGSGKSMLIKLAAGVLHPTGGEILLNGEVPGVETKKNCLLSAGPQLSRASDARERSH